MNTETADASVIDLSDFGTQVDDTYHALRAFNFMLESMSEYAPDFLQGTMGYGVSHLLRRQVDDVEEIKGKVFALTSRLRDAERALVEGATGKHDAPDASGKWVVLPNYRPGMEHELRAKPAPGPLDGIDLGAVARDTNLKEDTVRRVLERLLADPDPDPQAAASNG